MQVTWLLQFQKHDDYRKEPMKQTCLAMAIHADRDGNIVISEPHEYKMLAAVASLPDDQFMLGLEMAQKHQWLAPFQLNEELQATSKLTTPEG